MINFDLIKYYLVVLLSLFGFFVAFYIFIKKHKNKKLMCPRKGSCDEVVRSKYSTLFGINLEKIGLFYYGSVFLLYSFLLYSSLISYKIGYFHYVESVYLILSFFAFVFSIFLIGIQFFVIKKWCTWCLSSSLVSFLIFLVIFYLR